MEMFLTLVSEDVFFAHLVCEDVFLLVCEDVFHLVNEKFLPW